MAPNFSKNAILKGYVDYFCLICENYLSNEDDTIAHITKDTHQCNLEATRYIDEFKDDYIKKINSKYFCELCNKLLPVLAKVRIHISEPLHLEMKKHNVIKKKNNIVIAFDKIVINEQSWHGLYENSCAICNIEYDNKDEHKSDVSHSIKLIQIRVEFVENKHLYRKLDETTFQCLTCNIVSSINNLRTHFDEIEHKNKYQECCEEYNKLLEVGLDESILEKKCKQHINNEGEVKDKQREIIKPNTEIKSGKCEIVIKEEKGAKKANKQEITKNANEARNNSDLICTIDEICEEDICKVLNATDYITLDENGMSWCMLCNWVMSPWKVSEHGNGKHHQTLLKFHKERIEKYKSINKVSKTPQSNNNDTIKDNSILLNSLDKFQKKGILINFESNTATCKKCSNILEFNYDVINNHIKEHGKIYKKQNKKISFPSGKVDVSESKNMLFTSPVHIKQQNQEKKMEIKCDETNDDNKINGGTDVRNNAYEKLSKDVQFVKKHKRVVLNKTPINEFVEIITGVENGIFQDIIINNKFVINLFSLAYLVKNNNALECIACDENVNVEDLPQHLLRPLHERRANDIFVITEMDSEFIREVTQNKFHCGFCNTLATSWEDMQTHVKTTSHKESKMFAEHRMSQYKLQMASESFQTQTFDTVNLEMFAKIFK